MAGGTDNADMDRPATPLFTSGLSVREFALLDRLGPQPLRQVMGASVVRPGWQYLPALEPGMTSVHYAGYAGYGGGTQTANSYGRWQGSPYGEPSPSQVRNYKWHTDVVCELEVLGDAWNLARRQALDRLTDEALQAGADAVVGVTVRREDHELGNGVIELVVTGTAVRLPGSDGRAWPVLSDLSVQDYWRLACAGHEPVGLVATTAVMFASPPMFTRMRRTRAPQRNRQLDEITDAFRAGRETVRARLEGQISDAHGVGAVGVCIEHSVHRDSFHVAATLQSAESRGWHRGPVGVPYFVSGHSDVERRGWVITMHATGTAIRPRSEPMPGQVKPTVRMGGR